MASFGDTQTTPETMDQDSQSDTSDGSSSTSSTKTRIVQTAERVATVLQPFSILLTAIVQAVTVWKLAKEGS